MKALKGQIETVLKQYPQTSNSDIALTIQVWKSFYNVGDTIRVAQLYELPREDNVKRIRAKFNEEGKYLPTSLEVAKRRGIKELEWRRFMGYPSAPEGQESFL